MKTEGTGNKIMLIVMLCMALALFLYIRPKLFAPKPPPVLVNRLPEAEILGRYRLLDAAKEVNAMMFKNKVPFRDFMTYDFLLSQAKSFGIDIQSPGYFFSDGKQEWGTYLSLLDSSRIENGFRRLEQYYSMKDTLVFNRNVKMMPELDIYFFYDKNYMLIYHGNHVRRRVGKALFAVRGQTEKSWKDFLAHPVFKTDKIVLYVHSGKLKKYGFEYALLAHDSDSLNIRLKSYFHASRDLKIKEKKSGVAFERLSQSTKMLDLHLDISELRKDKTHPLYKLLSQLGKRINFPTSRFMEAWEGDISFQEGGTQLINEEVVEMSYDEEFNPIEIRAIRKVPVNGFSVIISVNKNSNPFVSSLFAKGIITREDKHYRFLFSPPLTLNILPETISAYTASRMPKVIEGSSCNGIWNYKGTDVAFRIDSLKKREIWGSMEFNVSGLVKRSKSNKPLF